MPISTRLTIFSILSLYLRNDSSLAYSRRYLEKARMFKPEYESRRVNQTPHKENGEFFYMVQRSGGSIAIRIIQVASQI